MRRLITDRILILHEELTVASASELGLLPH